MVRAISAEILNWGEGEKRMGGKNVETATIVDYLQDFCREWGKFYRGEYKVKGNIFLNLYLFLIQCSFLYVNLSF